MTRGTSAAVTGVGPVSAIGTGVEPFFEALLAGRTGTRALTRFEPARRGCRVAAEVSEPPARPMDLAAPMPRAVELALHAGRLALADAAWDGDRERIGVVVGTGVGNLDLTEAAHAEIARGARLSPAVAFRAFGHAAACELVREHDLRGPVATVSTGCNSGADALGMALDWIRLGRADAVLVGGTEAELTPTFWSVMGAARALAVRYNDRPETASRPFDEARDGNVAGEGAAFLVIESEDVARRRGARVRARLAGYASRAVGQREQYDPFNPLFKPEPMVRAMRAALADAGLGPEHVSAVSANGSASVFYDVLEAAAIAEVLGAAVDTTPVMSVKGALGQTGAVTPALQAIAAVLSIERGVLPPTANADHLDPRVRLRVVAGAPREGRLDAILCNAIGFGGFYYSSFAITAPASS